MPNLPTNRQNRQCAPPNRRAADRKSLAQAFLTFTQAAGALERSYAQLQAEVARLRGELEEANAELSKSLEETSRVRTFLTRVLEGLPSGVVVTDATLRPRMVNPEAKRLLGLLEDPWRPEKEGGCPAVLASLLAEAKPEGCHCEQEWTSDAVPCHRIIGISGAKLESPGGASETIWILRDITEHKRIAAEREAARRACALAEIAAVLAHEIRNPLGSLELFAGLLSEATRHMPEPQQWVMHLQAGLRSLSATVNNVLQFHTQPCTQFRPIEIHRLVGDTIDFLTPLARQRGLEIKLDNLLGPVTCAGDGPRLQQVFFNLALNSFHASASGGKVTILIRWAPRAIGEIVRLDFEDEGSGIDADVVEGIFEAGFTTKAGSPGLGLTVCKKVIEQHGGSIQVQSCPQQGSTFSVLLPIRREKS